MYCLMFTVNGLVKQMYVTGIILNDLLGNLLTTKERPTFTSIHLAMKFNLHKQAQYGLAYNPPEIWGLSFKKMNNPIKLTK